MKPIRMIVFLVTLAVMFSLASIALARGAPTKQKAFAQAVAVNVAPTVENVPVMTGYDVIQNTSEPRVSNAVKIGTVTTEGLRLSTTVDWRSIRADLLYTDPDRQAPTLFLLA